MGRNGTFIEHIFTVVKDYFWRSAFFSFLHAVTPVKTGVQKLMAWSCTGALDPDLRRDDGAEAGGMDPRVNPGGDGCGGAG
jgi:hypothetical protein